MALPITVPYTFGNATTAIPLSNLDSDYATVYQAVNGIGNGSVALANVAITGGTISGNTTASNVTVSSGTFTNVTLSNVTISSVSTPITAAEGGTGSSSAFTTNGVVYASSTSALATGSSLVWTGSALGIGTSSPSVALEVNGAIKLTAGNFSIAPSVTTNNASMICTNGGGTFFAGLDNSTGSSFGAGAYGAVIYNGANTPIVFYTNGSERARITSSGNLLVGTTSNPGGAGTINITGTYTTSGVTPMTAGSVGANPGTAAIFDGSGNLYKLSSSLRYKENITDWAVTNEQLNAFINVNPKLWDYIGKENGCAGFIAEDIEALGLKNAYNTSPLINYSNEGLPDSNRDFALIALQHKVLQKQEQAIQELSTLITAQSATIQSLTDRITALENK